MPKLSEIMTIKRSKKESDENLLIKLLKYPFTKKTSKAAKKAALKDMDEEQQKYFAAQVGQDMKEYFKAERS